MIGLVVAMAMLQAAPAPAGIHDLEFFVGQWTGESRFTPAFTADAQTTHETVAANCEKILLGSHIQCILRFQDRRQHQREVMLLWRYSAEAKTHQGVVMDSSAWGTLTYDLRWDAGEKAWIGELPTTTADGRKATERLLYRPARDGRSIHNVEMVRPDGAEDWTPTFEFVWRRK